MARDRQANRLAESVAADELVIDDGTVGSGGNHRQLFTLMAEHFPDADWLVALEDDAVPVDGFRHQLAMALAACPAGICGLYTGGPPIYPPCRRSSVCDSLRAAEEVDAHFINAPVLLHAVAYAIRADRVPDVIANVSGDHWDAAVSEWAQRNGITVAHTHPSLVDHLDGPPIITERVGSSARGRRKAWRTGGRTEWTSRAVELR